MQKLFQILKWMTLCALLVVLLAFTNKKQTQQYFNLHAISVQESEDAFVNEQIVQEYLKENSIAIDSVVLSDSYLNDLEQVLLDHPAVKTAEVYSDQLGKLAIDVAQRKAIVRIKTTTEDYYLDEQGKQMLLSPNYTPRLLIFSGDIGAEQHKVVFELASKINDNSFWRAQFTQLHFNNDELIIIPRVGDQRIHFGKLIDIDEKLKNLDQFYKQAMPVKGWQTYSDISLKYNNQIVCTKK